MTPPAVPLVLLLPGGKEHALVSGSRPARYVGTTADVTIPDDLAPLWHWHGTFLSDGQIGIFTGTYGVEGAFEQARIHMRIRAELEAARRPVIEQLSLWAA